MFLFYVFLIAQAYSIGENSNQMLDSIGDSNSSSSFDIERRSFSSNSNQSTIGKIKSNSSFYQFRVWAFFMDSLLLFRFLFFSSVIVGNYNSDHSIAFSTSSSQQISNQNNGSQSMTLSMDTTNNNRKINYTILSPHDERSTNITQFSDLSMNSNMASILQSGSNGQMNGPIGLNSFNEYSVNDLINDDNGDAFDMTFWENFENINYEADVMMSGFNAATKRSASITEHHKTSKLTTAKTRTNTTPPPSLSFASSTSNNNRSSSNNKRSNASFDESDRKRKRGNESKESKDNNGNMGNRIDTELSDEMQKFSDSLFGSDSIKTSKKIVVSGHSIIQKKSATKVAKTNEQTQSDIICIDDDDDDLVIVSDNTISAMDKRSISPAITKFCTNSKSSKISIDLDSPISTQSNALTFKSNEEQFHRKPSEPKEKEIPKPVKLPDPRLKEATAALIEQSIIRMTLSNDHSVHSADLRNITKILSEQDHHHALSTVKRALSGTVKTIDANKSVVSKPKEPSEPKQKPHSTLEINSNKSMPKSLSTGIDTTKVQADAKTNDTTKTKIEPVIPTKDGEQQPPKIDGSAKVPVSVHGNHLGTVPMDENENFLLDMMYKCLRGKRVQLSDSNHISSYNNYTQNHQQHTVTNRSVNGNDSTTRGQEKENNAIDTQNLSDEENIKATNSLLLPVAQRSMSLKRTMAKPISANQFAMARGYGVCHVRSAVSSTRAVQQNFFERMQAQQPNGSFSGTMMTIRNGSLIRLNNTNANLSGVNTAINQTKPNSPGPQSTNPTNSMNSAGTPSTANSSIVIVNSGGTPNATMSGQSYTIFRRPSSAQNIQLITRKTIDQTYAVMPVIHCVRARTMRPNATKTLPLQTDQLLASLKTMIRPQKLNHQTLATTNKVISVYKATLQQNAINDMQSRSQKFYHHSQTPQQTILMASPQKQNGHHSHSASNGTISPRSSHKSSSQKKS